MKAGPKCADTHGSRRPRNAEIRTETVLHVGLGAWRRLRCAQGPGRGGREAFSGQREGGFRGGGSCIFGGKQKRDGVFPSKSAPECLCFGPRCWLGSSPEREKREAGLPTQPQAPWRSAKPAVLCGRRVCAEGEARPQPRTTHNSVHSRLSFVPSLLPEEAPAIAGPSAAGPWRAGGCVSEHHAVSSRRGAGHARAGAQSWPEGLRSGGLF